MVGVDGRRFSLPKKSAARIFFHPEKTNVFASVYGMRMRFSGD